jgi:hypothetical protein
LRGGCGCGRRHGVDFEGATQLEVIAYGRYFGIAERTAAALLQPAGEAEKVEGRVEAGLRFGFVGQLVEADDTAIWCVYRAGAGILWDVLLLLVRGLLLRCFYLS